MTKLLWIHFAACLAHALTAHGYTYIGCYIDQNQRDLAERVERSGSISPNKCNSLCTRRNFLFFSLQDTDECWCGNQYGKYGVAPPNECNRRCRDNSAQCGGAMRNNIYATDYSNDANMRYIGCFVDSDKRDLPTRVAQDGSLTLPRCNDLCKSRRFVYFGMQNGNECWCGNDYGKHGAAPDRECDKRCSGEVGALCGGGFRNSVYATGYRFLPLPASNDPIPRDLTAELAASVRSQQVPFPTGVLCDRCLIAAWSRRFSESKSRVFLFKDINNVISNYPKAVRDKVQSLIAGGKKTIFEDYQKQIFGNYAVTGGYMGIARRVNDKVEMAMVAAEAVAFLVPKHQVFNRQSCSGFWFWTKCNTETIRVRIGYALNDIELIDKALRSQVFSLYTSKLN